MKGLISEIKFAIKRVFEFKKHRKIEQAELVKPQIISKDTYLERKDDDSLEDNIVVMPGEAGEADIIELTIEPNRIVCPDCGGITLEGLEFCHRCGGELNVNL